MRNGFRVFPVPSASLQGFCAWSGGAAMAMSVWLMESVKLWNLEYHTVVSLYHEVSRVTV
jgi:hypothetical protein